MTPIEDVICPVVFVTGHVESVSFYSTDDVDEIVFSAQYVESDLNEHSCSGLKTTTASKGIQYRFKITLNLNPRKLRIL